MPKVTLIDYTGKGHPDRLYAARLLAYTKNTRLNMTPDGFDAFMNKPESEILPELNYMAGTIASSWEFCHLTFAIEKVSRATAQQITRTRTASYAMQSQRISNMSDVTWDSKEATTETKYEKISKERFDNCMMDSISSYGAAIIHGMSLEDARDLLPIGVHCNLIASYNLRGLVDLCRARDSLRVQGAYRDVCAQMKAEVLNVWPWAETFFEPPNAKAIRMLEDLAEQLKGETGAMYRGVSGTLAKCADLIKKG